MHINHLSLLLDISISSKFSGTSIQNLFVAFAGTVNNARYVDGRQIGDPVN